MKKIDELHDLIQLALGVCIGIALASILFLTIIY